MIDFCLFYSAKVAVVFILMISSPTLEAQRNENDKFFNLMAAIGEHFSGEFNEAEKALELDLNGANSFLGSLHAFATLEIVTKNENGEFECIASNELEALVHGKNFDGTLKEKQENSKEKIQTFLAVSKCFILPEWELSIFDYWIEIIEMKTKNSQKPIFGVAIYKETSNKYKNENKEKAFKLSKENYKFLKQLNDQKFSIYESTNLLRAAFNWGDKGIDPELHLDSQDKKIQEYVQKDVEESCKKFDNEEEKMLFLNNVRYDLAINFEFNQRKDIYDRAEDLLSKWVGHRDLSIYGIEQISEESYLKKNASQMLRTDGRKGCRKKESNGREERIEGRDARKERKEDMKEGEVEERKEEGRRKEEMN
uniref:Uncharacterized protein n=1 Tax=Globodera rostochiensis TaxID=31243 RepID=A0A914H5M8_GLORO